MGIRLAVLFIACIDYTRADNPAWFRRRVLRPYATTRMTKNRMAFRLDVFISFDFAL